MANVRPQTIGEMADQFGLTLRTLRFYESRGLLSPTRVGSTRIYSEGEQSKLAEVVRWRAQGFTVSEMKDALRNGGFPKEKIDAQIQYLRQQRDEIEKSLGELTQLAQ